MTEAIGLLAAIFPTVWLTQFGGDPTMIATGTLYLHIVGPAYGFFGGGLALYFAAQGAGRMGWAMWAAVARVVVAAGGGWLAVTYFGGGKRGLFAVLSAALVFYGFANVVAVKSGAWFKNAEGADAAAPSVATGPLKA